MSESFRWSLVVPVKQAQQAKTRLRAPAPLSRPALARAIALDTLEAVCRALPPGDVVTVTSDEVVGPAAAALGARVIPDPGAGLNAAITAGIQEAVTASPNSWPTASRSHAPTAGPEARGIAVLLGDLPALRPEDLVAALQDCADHRRAVVPDHSGSGTVLLTAAPGILPEPGFGPGSAARHGESATVLTPDLPRLRRDVDDLADLQAVIELGVGRHTAELLAMDARPTATAH
ncbi:2-phospho-L-lactate guanylyltransferase [Ornithinimicrobium sp. F0845]|uniref:2-phospho-L-lactate guanylyltransferase n=1 Tax=Ornithinimicrobium sp. F0845 TaxID=2926412 RepID=UPI001FF22DA4|nr:2-phospho-L-lactate guanylyltransferase [Ornithinimicrobium sp. F0845]